MLRKRINRILRLCRIGRVAGGAPTPGPPSGSGLLLEDGVSFLLLESGFFLLLE